MTKIRKISKDGFTRYLNEGGAAISTAADSVKIIDDKVFRNLSGREAILAILFGERQPKGRLPMVMPASMSSVEKHCEDVPDDIDPYVDYEGHKWDIGYSLNTDYSNWKSKQEV